MSWKIPEKVIDISGVELTPGKPDVCLGNGDQGFECCCDECDYFLLCFPETLANMGLLDDHTRELLREIESWIKENR